MNHPAEALQRAIYAALQASADLQALIGEEARVYDRVPDKPVFPYVTIGDDEVLPDGNDCSPHSSQCFATIHVWARKGGKPLCKRVAGAVIDALTDEFPIEGQVLSEHGCDSARYFRDQDGLTERGVLTFRFLLDPLEG